MYLVKLCPSPSQLAGEAVSLGFALSGTLTYAKVAKEFIRDGAIICTLSYLYGRLICKICQVSADRCIAKREEPSYKGSSLIESINNASKNMLVGLAPAWGSSLLFPYPPITFKTAFVYSLAGILPFIIISHALLCFEGIHERYSNKMPRNKDGFSNKKNFEDATVSDLESASKHLDIHMPDGKFETHKSDKDREIAVNNRDEQTAASLKPSLNKEVNGEN